MPKGDDLTRNASGYYDPTAYVAIKKVDEASERFYKLLHIIFYICKIAGFELKGRITLVDLETGRIWK